MSDQREWNRSIENDPVDPNSAKLLTSITHRSGQFAGHAWLHLDFGPEGGIPYLVVEDAGSTPASFEYADESDPGPYAIPLDAPIEGGGDRQVIVLDRGRQK